jgi:hypothetical protein
MRATDTLASSIWPSATRQPDCCLMAQSPLGATRFWQGRRLRGADPPRLIEEPAELRTQKRQGPPEGGHEHGARWLLGGKAVEQTVASGAPEIVLAATAVRTARQM